MITVEQLTRYIVEPKKKLAVSVKPPFLRPDLSERQITVKISDNGIQANLNRSKVRLLLDTSSEEGILSIMELKPGNCFVELILTNLYCENPWTTRLAVVLWGKLRASRWQEGFWSSERTIEIVFQNLLSSELEFFALLFLFFFLWGFFVSLLWAVIDSLVICSPKSAWKVWRIKVWMCNHHSHPKEIKANTLS